MGILIKAVHWYTDVVRHHTALHNHPAVVSNNLQDSNERFLAPLNDLHYLSLAAVFEVFLAGNGHPYGVSVEGVQHAVLRDIDVILPVGNNNKSISFPGHLHCTFHYLKHFAACAPPPNAAVAFVLFFAGIFPDFSLFSHN